MVASSFNMPRTVELTGIQDNAPDNEAVDVTHSISSSEAGFLICAWCLYVRAASPRVIR